MSKSIVGKIEVFFEPDIRVFLDNNSQVIDAIGVTNSGYLALIRRSAGCIPLVGMDYDDFRNGLDNGICVETLGGKT